MQTYGVDYNHGSYSGIVVVHNSMISSNHDLQINREDGGDLMEIETAVDREEQVVVRVQLVAQPAWQLVEPIELVDLIVERLTGGAA